MPRLLTSFFQEHLQRVRGASSHTLRAYAHAIRLYLLFVAARQRRSVAALDVSHLDVDGVVAFLQHLECDRHNTAASRNCRLAALRSLFRHLAIHDPVNAERYHRVLSLPSKRARAKPPVYLEPEQVRGVLREAERVCAGGRDLALLLFLYNTGARVAEAIAVEPKDLDLGRPAAVRLHGKGNKDRVCPLWRDTASVLRRLADGKAGAVFRNARGQRLTRDGVAYILSKYVDLAAKNDETLRRCRVTPHVLRHSCAVALLQAGVDLTVIRDYLGHSSVATTNRYVSTNLDLRRTVLEAFWKKCGLGPVRTEAWQPSPEILRFLSSLGGSRLSGDRSTGERRQLAPVSPRQRTVAADSG